MSRVQFIWWGLRHWYFGVRNWKGNKHTRRFLNYSLFLGPIEFRVWHKEMRKESQP